MSIDYTLLLINAFRRTQDSGDLNWVDLKEIQVEFGLNRIGKYYSYHRGSISICYFVGIDVDSRSVIVEAIK